MSNTVIILKQNNNFVLLKFTDIKSTTGVFYSNQNLI